MSKNRRMSLRPAVDGTCQARQLDTYVRHIVVSQPLAQNVQNVRRFRMFDECSTFFSSMPYVRV